MSGGRLRKNEANSCKSLEINKRKFSLSVGCYLGGNGRGLARWKGSEVALWVPTGRNRSEQVGGKNPNGECAD